MSEHPSHDSRIRQIPSNQDRPINRRRVVVLECYVAHGECLEFQIQALERTGMQVEVWTHPSHARRRKFRSAIRHVLLEQPIIFSIARRLWLHPPALLIINTATGPLIRNLLWLIRPLGLVTVGVFHDVDKLRSPSARMIARMIDGRLMLAQHLAGAAESAIGLPVDHAHFLSSHGGAEPDPQEVLIIIPGAFTQDKKDSAALFDVARDPRLHSRVKFVLLGRFPKDPLMTAWWQRCVVHGIRQRFLKFTEYVPQPVFDDYLHRGSAILPLIQPGAKHYPRFRTEKVSGAINLALGKCLPLLIHADLAAQWRFGPAVMTYNDSHDLVTVINHLSEHQNITRRVGEIANSNEADIGYQQALYLNACIRAVRRFNGARGGPGEKPAVEVSGLL